MSVWFLLVVWSLATYRITRFIVLDTLIEGTRDKVLAALEPKDGKRVVWREKVMDLITCPLCSSAYVAAGILAAHRIFVGSFPVPVWMWLAVWAGSLVIYTYIDSED